MAFRTVDPSALECEDGAGPGSTSPARSVREGQGTMRTVPHLVAIDGRARDARDEASAAAMAELSALVERAAADLDDARALFSSAFDADAAPEARAAALDRCLLVTLRLYEPGLDRANLATVADRLADPLIAAAARQRQNDEARFELHLHNIPYLYREVFEAPFFERCREARDRRAGAAPPARDEVELLLDTTAMIVDAMVQAVTGRPRSPRR
jgi:hypothetical protein